MRKSLLFTGLLIAVINVTLWFSKPAIRAMVDNHYGRVGSPGNSFIMISYGVQELLVYFDPWMAEIVIPLVYSVGFIATSILLTDWHTQDSHHGIPSSY